MRPTPAETVDGIVRILRDTVSPAVTDDHARGQLAQVISVLGQMTWDDPGLVVATSWARTEAVLDQCRAWLAADPARGDAFTPLPPRAPAEVSQPTFAEVNASLVAARGALATFLVELRAWRSSAGPDSSNDLFDGIGAAFAEPT